MTDLSVKHPVFSSEADFQFALAWEIKAHYPECNVIMEYVPEYDPDIHIDIVVYDGKFIPIELKYKTCKSHFELNGVHYYLKNHGAKDVNCYKYLYDIQRLEAFGKEYSDKFSAGYAIFLTNFDSYRNPPQSADCVYSQFSLENRAIKTGVMDWSSKASKGTKKGCEDPISLKGKYIIDWQLYSNPDDEKFYMTIAEIKPSYLNLSEVDNLAR